MAKVQGLLNNVTNYNLRITQLVTRNAFAHAHSVTELLEAKSNHFIKGFDLIGSLIGLLRNESHTLDDYHGKCYREGL